MKFNLGAVLSITTERLLCSIDDLYSILHHMTGDSLFTHQLPRAGKTCKKPLLAQFPQLAGVQVPADLQGEEACRTWLDTHLSAEDNTS